MVIFAYPPEFPTSSFRHSPHFLLSHIPAAAAAKSLQLCPTLCDPIDRSPPGSPSLGFSRQEHWSPLPFPFPMHENETWKCNRSVVSNSLRPHELQPTRLLRPWNFPGKSTGVGCHFLLQCMKAKSENEVAQPCLTLRDPMDFNLPGFSVHGIFQARITGVGSHCLLWQRIIRTYYSVQFSSVAQSCPTLHDPMDCSLPGSSVHGIFQARILEWSAIAFS